MYHEALRDLGDQKQQLQNAPGRVSSTNKNKPSLVLGDERPIPGVPYGGRPPPEYL